VPSSLVSSFSRVISLLPRSLKLYRRVVELGVCSSLVISVIIDAGLQAGVIRCVGLNDGRPVFAGWAFTPGVVGVSSVLDVRTDWRQSDAVSLDFVASRVGSEGADDAGIEHLGKTGSRVE